MKASVYHAYGPPEVVTIREMPMPEPGPDDVLIRVHATTVSAGDWRMRSLQMPPGFGAIGRLAAGVFGPRQPVLGTDLAGTVVATGAKVSDWAEGDRVVAYPGARMGAHAEYVAMPARGAIARKPAGLSFEEAAAIPFGGLTALEFLRDRAGLEPGEHVLVVGASGATGSAAVQIARHFGARVTGVCSAANEELVLGLGAERVIDYTREDFAAGSARYDMIVDTTGSAPWARSADRLTDRGRLVVISGSLGDMLRAPFVSRRGGKRLVTGVAHGSAAGLRLLTGLAESGDFRPVIDRVYPFEMITRAHAHVDTGRKKGSVVVSVVPRTAGSRAA